MSDATSPLSDPGTPPLVEVALTLQFERIPDFLGPHAGFLWAEAFRDEFPIVEERPPVEQALELEQAPLQPEGVRIRLLAEPSLPRFLFVNANGKELIQLQNDRLSYNWRMRNDAYDYPRYPALRQSFSKWFQVLERFVEREKLGSVVPNQCELLYVNHVVYREGERPHQHLGRLIKPWAQEYTALAGAALEDVRLSLRHVIRDPDGRFLGRLNVALDPAYLAGTNPIYRIQFVARGAPLGEGLAGGLEFLDRANQKLPAAFSEFISEETQDRWKRDVKHHRL